MSLNSANPTNPIPMSFSSLKKNKSSVFQQLQKQLEKTQQVGTVDERFWKLSTDKSGNGFAIIRFLPAGDGEDMPFVKLYSHAFQGPGGWYIENSSDHARWSKTLWVSTTVSCGTVRRRVTEGAST